MLNTMWRSNWEYVPGNRTSFAPPGRALPNPSPRVALRTRGYRLRPFGAMTATVATPLRPAMMKTVFAHAAPDSAAGNNCCIRARLWVLRRAEFLRRGGDRRVEGGETGGDPLLLGEDRDDRSGNRAVGYRLFRVDRRAKVSGRLSSVRGGLRQLEVEVDFSSEDRHERTRSCIAVCRQE